MVTCSGFFVVRQVWCYRVGILVGLNDGDKQKLKSFLRKAEVEGRERFDALTLR